MNDRTREALSSRGDDALELACAMEDDAERARQAGDQDWAVLLSSTASQVMVMSHRLGKAAQHQEPPNIDRAQLAELRR